MSGILSVGGVPAQDSSIIKKQYHTYTPYTTAFGKNDEVRIAIHSQDLYVLPSESYILMEVEVERKAGDDHAQTTAVWAASPAAFLLSEIRYEVNGVEIASQMKMVAALPSWWSSEAKRYHRRANTDKTLGKHEFVIPLYYLLGK